MKFHIIVVCFLVLGCTINSENKNSVVNKSMNTPQISLDELKQAVFSEGDTSSYLELRKAYLDFPSEDFLFWSLVMANKHGYPRAHTDVFFTFLQAYDCEGYSLSNLDEKTCIMALKYLKTAAEKGEGQAIDIFENHFKDKSPCMAVH